MDNPMYGKKHTSEAKNKIRLANIGKPKPLEQRRKISIARFGPKHPFFGKKRPEHAKMMKDSWTPERRLAKSKLMSGTMNRMYGISLVPWNKGKRGVQKSHYRNIPRPDYIREILRKNREKQVFPKIDTKPEKAIQDALILEKIKFEKHVALFGRPDVFIAPKLCVFIDGDYWHNLPKQKIRDVLVTETLEKDGYTVLRIWEHEIKDDLTICIDRIREVMVSI